MKRFFIVVTCVVLLAVGGLAGYLFMPLKATSNVDIYIAKGSSVTKASETIRNSGLVRFPTVFSLILRAYIRLNHSSIYSGAYRFNSSHTHAHVLRAILSGKQALKVRVTFPEGISLNRFASILQKNVGVDSSRFMQYATSDSLIAALGIDAQSLEGYLMPETYEYYWKEPVEDILENLVSQQSRIWTERFSDEARTLGKTRHEVLTLASIVEAETPQPDERSRVAGVYVNRLHRGMRLEADPTVQYALGGESRRVLLRDLDVDNPYNTYRHTGLPPGPINSPSVLSIDAALHPEQHSYIFFCAKGDGSNSHSFATTSVEHHANVLRYRKNRRLQRE